MKNGQFQDAKVLLEKEIRASEIVEPSLYMLCGRANLTLGYYIIAEQMFIKCLLYPGFEAQAFKCLGDLASLQDDTDKTLFNY
jgi:hypothetical protein